MAPRLIHNRPGPVGCENAWTGTLRRSSAPARKKAIVGKSRVAATRLQRLSFVFLVLAMIGHVFQIFAGKEFLTESHGKPGWLPVCHASPADQFETMSDTADKRTLRGMRRTYPNDALGELKDKRRNPRKATDLSLFPLLVLVEFTRKFLIIKGKRVKGIDPSCDATIREEDD
jgi:hypothetical protein